MKHAYIPILVALVMTSGLISRDHAGPGTSTFVAPTPVASAPLEDDLILEVSLRF